MQTQDPAGRVGPIRDHKGRSRGDRGALSMVRSPVATGIPLGISVFVGIDQPPLESLSANRMSRSVSGRIAIFVSDDRDVNGRLVGRF